MQGLRRPLKVREPFCNQSTALYPIFLAKPGSCYVLLKSVGSKRVQMLTSFPWADAHVHQRDVLDRSGLLSLQLWVARASWKRELRVQPGVLLEWEHMPAIVRMTARILLKEV
jgi:hypothetical protein